MGAPESGLEAAGQSTAETLLTAFRTIKDAERAAHAGVLDYWMSIRGDKEFPPLRDLDPLEISDAGPSSILFELIGGGQDAEIRHLGDDLASQITVQRLIDAPNPSLLSTIARKLPIVAIARDFLAFEDNFTTPAGLVRCWVTLLPLSSCGSWVDYVYAFVSLETSAAGAVPVADPPGEMAGDAPTLADSPVSEEAAAVAAANAVVVDEPGAGEVTLGQISGDEASVLEPQTDEGIAEPTASTEPGEAVGLEEISAGQEELGAPASPDLAPSETGQGDAAGALATDLDEIAPAGPAIEEPGPGGPVEDDGPPDPAGTAEATSLGEEGESARAAMPAPAEEALAASLPSEEIADDSVDKGSPAEGSPAKAGPGFSRLIEGIANLAGFYGQGVRPEPEVRVDVPALEKAVEEPSVAEMPPVAEEVTGPTVPGETETEVAPAAGEIDDGNADDGLPIALAPGAADRTEPAEQPFEETEAQSAPAMEGSLQNKLSEVRAKADEAREAQRRATEALHEGLSAAYDFALDAEASPEEYLRMVEAQGMKIQLRSPMAPVARLAFDGVCDPATIKQFEAALAWALKEELPRGALLERIQSAGGISELLDGAR